MELQFEKKVCSCLRRNVRQVQNQEQTLEVKLPDGQPDIGNILAAWGQCVLRGKEWRGDGMSVSGGVMAWVLYAPADGSEPRSLEAWLPVQVKWDFAQSQREGSIRTSWLLRSIDARMLSARKMMVRASVGALGEALEPWDAELYAPGQVPEDVELLRGTYPAMVPREAGEKTFQMDEEFSLPQGSPPVERILCCELTPVVTERKVLGGKAVFHGKALIHLLYRGIDAQLHTVDFEPEFSQFSELDQAYDKEATVSVLMAVSSLEQEEQEGRIRIKCGLVAQYEICDRVMLELVEDAYSPCREVKAETRSLNIPVVLDERREPLQANSSIPLQASRIVDLSATMEHPVVRRAGNLAELEIPGAVQILYYDDQGELRGATAKFNELWELPAGEAAMVLGTVMPTARPAAVTANGQLELTTDLEVCATTLSGQGMNMVTALELGEPIPPDPARPSLILCRPGHRSLWELAKSSGSTVSAICSANGITEEPENDRVLLIPVS